jgi:CRISPR-associated protein Csb2
MIVLELGFPIGRYHATPWGRHVNEGATEWPPSPWRIVRALMATWYLKARQIPEATVRSLVNKLSIPPRFCLPPASTSHTRHYMPYIEGKNQKTTKVFDTFIQLPENETVLVAWDAVFAAEEHAALKILASRLGYFGRAESLVVARFLDGIATIKANAFPIDENTDLPEKTELVRVLAPMSSEAYSKWRDEFLAANSLPASGKTKSSKKAKEDGRSRIPADLFAALHADTGDLQAGGWNLPPGAQFLDYARPENAFAPAARPRPRRKGLLPTVARYALTSVVPPSITKALAVAQQIHTILCKQSNGHPVFTGAGRRGHQHAHIFCESIGDPNAHITHVTVFAPEGFDEKAVEALRNIVWTWGFDRHHLRLVLHGVGKPEEFLDCKLFAHSQVWRSLTPFVSTRRTKTFRDGRPKMDSNGWQKGSPGHDLLRLLGMLPHGGGAEVRCLKETAMPYAFGQRRFRSLQFLTQRHGGKGSRGNGCGSAFTITFLQPVSGPLALGYGAHFSLGLFAPANADE